MHKNHIIPLHEFVRILVNKGKNGYHYYLSHMKGTFVEMTPW